MKNLKEKDDVAINKVKQEEKDAADKRKDIQLFQLFQIRKHFPTDSEFNNAKTRGLSTDFSHEKLSGYSGKLKRAMMLSQMSIEELRLNKGLLREISQKKKQLRLSSQKLIGCE